MRELHRIAAFGLWLAAMPFAQADFVPGAVYVSAQSEFGCTNGPNDRIYEFNPTDGSSRVFQIVPEEHCAGLNGLSFSPAGRLRAGNFFQSSILEFDGDGGVTVPLGPADGLDRPVDLAFGQTGDLIVMNRGDRNILRFPSGAGPGESIMDVIDVGTVAAGPSGEAYVVEAAPHRISRWTAASGVTPFATFASDLNILDVVVDSAGTLTVLTSVGIDRFIGGDPTNHIHLPGDFHGLRGGVLSIDELSFIAVGQASALFFERISLTDATRSFLGTIPQFNFFPAGAALYVPEPCSAGTILVGLGVVASRRLRIRSR